jgi:polysaccharide export outer membrane protein
MPNQPFFAVQLRVGRRSYGWCWLAVALVASLGCHAAPHRAAELPDHFLAGPAKNLDQINLANMSGLGMGTTLVGPGDLVAITINSGGEKEKVEPVLARVSESGSVNVPLVGEVPVAGVEPFEAGARIAAASVERGVYRQPAVVLKIEEPAYNRVTVLGAVAEPGVKKLPRNSSDVVTAIAKAGGFTKLAGTEIEVMRQNQPSFMATGPEGGQVVQASYNDPNATQAIGGESRTAGQSSSEPNGMRTYRLDLAQANPSHKSDYVIGDGDIVMVLPEKDRMVHVTGLVNKPDQFKIPRNHDVNVLDAIAMAGGVNSPVADKVYVIRHVEGEREPVVVQVSIASAKRNGKENLRLAPGDLVSVEQTPTTLVFDTVTAVFNVGLGLGSTFTSF